jgi:dihydrofolate reductase
VSRPPVFFVVARADNGVIGDKGGLPWHLPEDLKHFKAMTARFPMLMGRRTFESLPRVLPGRRHIVLTRDRGWRAEGAEVVHSPEEAFSLVEPPERLAVIGGAQVFETMLPYAFRIELTEVHAEPEGDTLMPPFDPGVWREFVRVDREAVGERPPLSFVTLLRRA